MQGATRTKNQPKHVQMNNGVMRYRQRDEITEWIPDSDSVRQF